MATQTSIMIKKSKRGSFTKYAEAHGETVQAAARRVLADPHASGALKKKANFARNAAGWNH